MFREDILVEENQVTIATLHISDFTVPIYVFQGAPFGFESVGLVALRVLFRRAEKLLVLFYKFTKSIPIKVGLVDWWYEVSQGLQSLLFGEIG